jgi:hypothetical protein
MTNKVLYYAIFGVLSALLAWGLVPTAFPNSIIAVPVFGAFAVAASLAGIGVERALWARLGAKRADSILWRIGVRLAIYWLLPAALVFLIGSVAPAMFHLKAGFVSALALTYCPLIVRAFVPEPRQS